MSKPHIKFPSIEQFKHVVQHVRKQSEYHSLPLPKITFFGTVKLHGTNGAVVRPVIGTTDDMYVQSRERVLDLVQDNAGFCAFVESAKTEFSQLIEAAIKIRPSSTGSVQIYGEWCGGNIQKGVGVCNLPKTFVVFGVRISEDAESQDWLSPTEIIRMFLDAENVRAKRIFAKTDFTTFMMVIDFKNPELSQNPLVGITIEVEEDCPVTRQFLPDGDICRVGEGVVWEAIDTDQPINIDGLRMKVKGELHSKGSKVKVLAPVDELKLSSVNEFCDTVLTDGRLQQGLKVLEERGLDVHDAKNTGEYIKWVMGDVLKEEFGMMVNSGLCTKDVTGKLSRTARDYFLTNI